MATLLAEVRAAVRTHLRTPLVAIGVVLSLAVGVGTAATVVVLTDVLLLRPPDVPEPRTLVAVYSQAPDDTHVGASFPDFADFQRRAQSLDGIAAYLRAPVSVDDRTGSRQSVQAEIVSGNYFDLLGLRASEGRLLAPADDLAGAAPAVVVSERFWQTAPGARAGVLRINGVAFAVVGVVPGDFSGLTMDWGAAPQLWLPVAQAPRVVPVFEASSFVERRDARSFLLVGRLRPGVGRAAAQADLDRVTRQLAREHPETNDRWSAAVLPATSMRFWVGHRPTVQLVLAVMGALTVLVWLVSCANAATLLTAHLFGRRRELLVRQALGASHGRLARQLLLDGVVLALPAAILAAACTTVIGAVLEAGLSPFRVPIRFELGLDGRSASVVAAFTAATTLLLVLLSAVSAFGRTAARPAIARLLGDRSGGPDGQRGLLSFRRLLVLGQVAGAAMLLVVSALLVQTVRSLHDADPGFDPRASVVMASIDLSVVEGASGDPAVALALRHDLIARLRDEPGVDAVSVADRPPLSPAGVTLALATDDARPEPRVPYTVISDDYFRAIDLPLVAGRSVRAAEADRTVMPVVVNERLARQLADDRMPLGRALALRIGNDRLDAEVVGVARDAATTRVREAPEPHVYVPHTHVGRTNPIVLLRSALPPDTIGDAVRRAARAVDPRIPTPTPTTLEETVAASMAQERFLAAVALGTALVALLLAVLGLYGLTTHVVIQRRRELGVRIALGATRRDLAGLVLREGLVPALLGVGAGLAAAAAASTALASFVYGIGLRDPASYAGAALLLIAVTVTACLGAVRRAWAIDPAALLRTD